MNIKKHKNKTFIALIAMDFKPFITVYNTNILLEVNEKDNYIRYKNSDGEKIIDDFEQIILVNIPYREFNQKSK